MLSAMFYIGSNVMDWPLEAQRAVADGMLTLLLLYSKTYSFVRARNMHP